MESTETDTILVRFLKDGKCLVASHFQPESPVSNLFDLVGVDCFLETKELSLASGQGHKKLREVFKGCSSITLNVVTVADCWEDDFEHDSSDFSQKMSSEDSDIEVLDVGVPLAGQGGPAFSGQCCLCPRKPSPGELCEECGQFSIKQEPLISAELALQVLQTPVKPVKSRRPERRRPTLSKPFPSPLKKKAKTDAIPSASITTLDIPKKKRAIFRCSNLSDTEEDDDISTGRSPIPCGSDEDNTDNQCLEEDPLRGSIQEANCIATYPEANSAGTNIQSEEHHTVSLSSDDDSENSMLPELESADVSKKANISLGTFDENCCESEVYHEPPPPDSGDSNEIYTCTPSLYRGTWPTVGIGQQKSWSSCDVADKLLDPQPSELCKSVPQQCTENKSFIIDITKLDHCHDIIGDDNGAFQRPSITKVQLVVEDENTRFAKKKEKADLTLKRKYYIHKGTPTFQRTVYEIFYNNGTQHRFSMLQYRFTDGIEKDIKLVNYGNSEEGKVFMPRRKSLKNKIKELSKSMPPAKVVSTLHREAGGAVHLESISATPRNYMQARNLKRGVTNAHHSRSAGSSKATNFDAVMKMSMKGDFIRSFELSKGTKPRAFCATEQQLKDLERYCTGPSGVILEIDPTFSLGAFYLTCTTFRHPQFQNQDNGKNVLMPGPYMIHARKEVEDYEYFARHLSAGVRGKGIRVCGSDGEKALVAGFKKSASFKDSIWLICMIHAKDNCKRKLQELGVEQKNISRILKHIYGNEFDTPEGRKRVLGLVDADTPQDFDDKLAERVRVWGRLEEEDTGKQPCFSEWFITYKVKECKDSMLAPLREQAGLGNPPCQFTTNDVECENLRVKREVDWKKLGWEQAANHLHSKTLAHYEQLNRAVYKEGEYRMAADFKHLEMEPYEWAKLQVPERRQHLQKANLKLLPSGTSLCITAEESCITGFSIADLKEVWDKAEQLVGNEELIGHHPTNPRKHVVYDEDAVHTVIRDSGSLYVCDNNCVIFKEHDSMFCHHTIAVAEREGCLPDSLGLICTNISRKSAKLLNTAINTACRGAGEKKSKRKGENHKLSSAIAMTLDAEAHGDRLPSVPSTSSLHPTGSGAVCAAEKMLLPTLTSLQVSMQNEQPFTITLRQGLIRRCHGCGTFFSERSKNSPHDLILKKMDFKEYKHEGVWHRSTTLANTYYHLNADCMRRKFPRTQLRDIVLYDDMVSSLQPGHMERLHNFGWHGACKGACN